MATGPKTILTIYDGPDIGENIGLNIEDRKRRRSGPETKGTMDTEGGLKMIESGALSEVHQGAVFSVTDSTVTKQFSRFGKPLISSNTWRLGEVSESHIVIFV